jgi:YggT family protein
MAILIQILSYLIDTFGGLFYWAVLLRFLLQVARADFYNPISQALVRITNPPLKPLRKIIPGFLGIDMAALVLAIAIKFVLLEVLMLLQHGVMLNVLMALLIAVLHCAITIVNIYFLTMIGSIIVSWVAQGSYSPVVTLINQLAEPVLGPFRRIVPAMGGLDLSPMVAFAALYVLQILLGAGAQALGIPTQRFLGMLILGI